MGEKSTDPDFINYLSSFDIILLQETWSLTPPYIPGFTSHHLPAYKSKQKGRPCAGLCCLSRPSSGYSLTPLASQSRFFQAFLLSCKDSKILVFNIYIPPSYTVTPSPWDEVKLFTTEYLVSKPSAPLLFLGDFNARLGPNNLALSQHMIWDSEELIPPEFQGPRLSLDSAFNNHTSQMVDLCLEFNLNILNGSTANDIPGRLTHFSSRGTSVLDYALASSVVLPFLTDFAIDSRSDSDHLPIHLALSLPSPNTISKYPRSQPRPRLKWSPKIEEAFNAWSRTKDSINLNLKLTETNSPSTAIETYESLSKALVQFLRAFSSNNSYTHPPSWFDTECWNAKKCVRQFFSSVHRDPP